MSDNVLQTLQKLVQDVIAPDVRELKVRMDGLDKRIDGLEKQIDANTKAILSAIAESKAQSELAAMGAIASLRERVAVLESKRN